MKLTEKMLKLARRSWHKWLPTKKTYAPAQIYQVQTLHRWYSSPQIITVHVSEPQQNSPLAATIVSTPSASGIGISFPAYELFPNGSFAKRDIPRSDLYSKFSLQGRDVRVLISSFNYPTILVRKQCILVDIKV